ncbi:MAG: bifunctional glutamate N-acetyltransferase/amino-acid acetyltransferase ArgJ [Candidatus Omnitrophica bacterium]|nr:bifunctional glutamate N-acetyltransferase/amino-acid acetyltransferase ArgJ [Candidatus Omnitrophota bacterium]
MKKPFWEKRRGGSVTTPEGFYANGMYCGIKKKKKKYDSSLIFSKTPCVAAGVFTTNRVKAWCVQHSMKAIRGPKQHAILASSGNANCVNGQQGKQAVLESVQEAASLLKIAKEEVLIAQTGLIGVPFPLTAFKRGLPKLVSRLSKEGGRAAAKGILTTDLKIKEVALSFYLGNKKVSIGAIAKGAGMVHPNMATMLCFITTDAAISKSLLKRAVRHASDNTFNQIAIDNDQSTNDMVLCLANGKAGNAIIQKVDADYHLFREALEEVCRIIAYAMVDDGEGVSHICTLRVSGAKNPTEAKKLARHISNSMLFKTMLAGSDPNWGRIVAAIGSSGVSFDLGLTSISFDGVNVVTNGKLRALNLPKARKVLQTRSYVLDVVIGKGRGRAEFITCDLTQKYVSINSNYS